MKFRAVLFVSSAFLIAGCAHTHVPLPAPPAAAPDVSVARGEYIVRNAAVCGQCHAADPERDVDGPLSGGTEFRDWRVGTSRAANLTSDSETGLGSWSDAEIVRALRDGERKDGRVLVPVMPYVWFHDMSDDDAFAVARYLKTLPPVRHAVSQSPNILFRLGKALFVRPLPANPVTAPRRGATAEYGGYLAQHVALCAECHTPRTGLRAQADKSRLFAGDAHPSKSFPANPANITPDAATGIGTWSEEQFISTIRTGVDPKGIRLHPFMPSKQIARMSDDDLRAIYRYLRTVPPIHNEVPRRTQ